LTSFHASITGCLSWPNFHFVPISFFIKKTVMQHQTRLSQLMRLSWQIQKRKNCTRSKSLQSAWAILLNEDLTVFYLVKRHSHEKYPNKTKPQELSLFTPQ